MRKIKRNSLALLALPILFSGCMQEKISAIIPLKSTGNIITTNPEEMNLSRESEEIEITFSSNIERIDSITENNHLLTLNRQYSLTPLNLTIDSIREARSERPSILDELALNVEQSMNPQFEEEDEDELLTEALEVGGNWSSISKEDEILETAKEFLGVKYIWAANGPNAFDCSGYTKYVFNTHGITLPRYSGNQAKIGMKVAYNELEKGDLVFFDTERHSKSKKRVNHVGIYLGQHQFIHASSGGKKVMISSFDDKKFYRKKFMHGRRIVNTVGTIALASHKGETTY